MRLAILGATSQIAKDLVLSISSQGIHELLLYARRPEVVTRWLSNVGLTGRYAVTDFSNFCMDEYFDAILNFVGVGDPAQTANMGELIFGVTLQYDELALRYVRQHPVCRYIFLSSGAAYGGSFEAPVDANTKAEVPINNLQVQDYYAVSKLYAECRHRSLPHLPIIDIRVFNYFSRTQDMKARFFITDIMRAIQNKTVLQTSPEYIVRDFICPYDFWNLVNAILTSPATNTVVDCYSCAPIDKHTLLATMQEKLGLQYEMTERNGIIKATGTKPHYYSLNTHAAEFGYQPTLTSLEGVLKEATELLK